MMNRRSTSRSRRRSTEMTTSESRQPQQEDGRSSRRSSSQQQQQSNNNNVPRSPRSTPGNQQQQQTTTPSKSSSSTMSTHPKTRCYRLNLEKPFDIRTCKSPLGRDYSGPPIHESDLPPAAGPVEYIPPIHLCSKEEINARRHSWGGVYARSFQQSMSSMGADLMMNLHVSNSDDSTNSNSNSTSIAITTARIFRGIEVDRNGVITSMNDRAKRSAAKNGGSNKTKVGEKSRQAAKIDKAKDLIDDVDNGGGAGGMSDEENDPTKIVSLFVMGEYEDLNDLVRDGSKKLRDSKSVSDETLLSYNRPSPYRSQGSSQGFGSSTSAGGPLSPIQQDVTMSSAASPVPPPPSSQGPSSPIANIRKRVFSADKSRSRSYKQVPRSAPPKLKSNPRDSSATSGSSSRRTSRSSPRSSSQQQQQTASSPQATYDRQHSVHGHAGGPFGCVPLTAHGATTSSVDPSKGSSGQHSNGHYFQQNCNFFPGNSDWTEALGNFNLWNCGANVPLSRTMSPHSNPSSPRNGDPNGQPQDFHSPRVTGGGVYHGSGAPVSPHQHTSYHSSSGYHHHQQQVHHHHHHQGSTSVNSGYTGYGAPQYRDEGRDPSYNHRSSGVGARDTVVM